MKVFVLCGPTATKALLFGGHIERLIGTLMGAAEGLDAGIHFGEYIEKDMIAVRVSPDHKPAIVGSPDYVKSHGKPKSPRDLLRHRCINFRHGDAGLYRWEFEKGKKSLSVAVNGRLIVDDLDLVIRAAIDGVGLAYTAEQDAALHLASGALAVCGKNRNPE